MRKKQFYFLVISIIALTGIFSSIIFQTNQIYTHIFYIAIALTTIWYPSYTVLVGCLYASEHLLVEFFRSGTLDQMVLLRAFIIVFVSIVLSKISNVHKEYKDEISELSYESQHDSLTRLYNRRYFYNHLESELSLPIATFICDIDRLKATNDKYGHAVGDALIVGMADFLNSLLRTGAILARLGGDEFGIMVPNCNAKLARQYAEEIETELRVYNQTKEPHLQLSFSIGYAICEDRRCIYDTIKKADRAMYYDKMRKRTEKKK
jgi:diguanylate cyclase (GGDEF)-like protein